MTKPRQSGEALGDAGARRPEPGERTEAGRERKDSPAQRAVANQEKAFESGEENPT